MTHEMKLQKTPFYLMVGGMKKYEFRLFDEKRRKILVGDSILFRYEENTLVAEVTDIVVAATWEELDGKIDPCKKGAPTPLCQMMREYYSVGEEEKYGCVAIGIKTVSCSPRKESR